MSVKWDVCALVSVNYVKVNSECELNCDVVPAGEAPQDLLKYRLNETFAKMMTE